MGKQVNVFGLPLTVPTEEEIQAIRDDPNEYTIKAVSRVADMIGVSVYPALARRRHKVLCDVCHEPCWNDPLSSLVEEKEVRVCIPCLPGYLDANDAEQQPKTSPSAGEGDHRHAGG